MALPEALSYQVSDLSEMFPGRFNNSYTICMNTMNTLKANVSVIRFWFTRKIKSSLVQSNIESFWKYIYNPVWYSISSNKYCIYTDVNQIETIKE